jgi:hypothetical protein
VGTTVVVGLGTETPVIILPGVAVRETLTLPTTGIIEVEVGTAETCSIAGSPAEMIEETLMAHPHATGTEMPPEAAAVGGRAVGMIEGTLAGVEVAATATTEIAWNTTVRPPVVGMITGGAPMTATIARHS